VDDDGKAGPSSCREGAKARETIQSAVDASGPGDTILVCPGIYEEQVIVDDGQHGLTLKGVSKWKATVRAFSGMGDEVDLIEVNGVDRVRIQWLRLVAPTGGDCVKVSNMVDINDSRGAQVRALRIRPAGGGNWDSSCGYDDGIDYGEGSSGLIAFNLISDWDSDGIQISEDAGEVTIRGNSLRYFHGTTDSTEDGDNGISVDAAGARILDNVIKGLRSAGKRTPILGDAIEFDSYPIFTARDYRQTVVRGNRVSNVYDGLDAYAEEAPSFLDGMRVVDNRFVGRKASDEGIDLDNIRDAKVEGNAAHNFDVGLYLGTDTTDTDVQDNDLLGNRDLDCSDDSSGAGTGGTANAWVDNQGASSSPTEICSVN